MHWGYLPYLANRRSSPEDRNGTQLDAQKMRELYGMRWAIAVCFKECKQHLGFLKEQACHYACYGASIHLSAIRFCLLVIAKGQHDASDFAQTRPQSSENERLQRCSVKPSPPTKGH